MALRRVFGFDHLPNITSASSPGFTNSLGNYPIVTKNGTSNTKAAVISSLGTLTAAATSGATSLWWVINAASCIEGTPVRSWMGFRLNVAALGSITAGHSLIIMASNSWDVVSTDRLVLLLFSEIPSYTTMAGKDYYIEFCFNWTLGTVERYIRNVTTGEDTRLSDLTVAPSAVATLFTARNVGIHFAGANGANNQCTWRDIYFLDDTEDSTLCTRLGPQRVKPCTLSATTGSGWTPSAGADENAVLNLAVSATNLLTPTLTSPANLNPLEVNLTYPSGVDGKVNAVFTVPGATKTNGSDTQLITQFKLSDVSGTQKSLTVPNTMQLNQNGRIAEKAPGGASWTAANVSQTKLILTPSS